MAEQSIPRKDQRLWPGDVSDLEHSCSCWKLAGVLGPGDSLATLCDHIPCENTMRASVRRWLYRVREDDPLQVLRKAFPPHNDPTHVLLSEWPFAQGQHYLKLVIQQWVTRAGSPLTLVLHNYDPWLQIVELVSWVLASNGHYDDSLLAAELGRAGIPPTPETITYLRAEAGRHQSTRAATEAPLSAPEAVEGLLVTTRLYVSPTRDGWQWVPTTRVTVDGLLDHTYSDLKEAADKTVEKHKAWIRDRHFYELPIADPKKRTSAAMRQYYGDADEPLSNPRSELEELFSERRLDRILADIAKGIPEHEAITSAIGRVKDMFRKTPRLGPRDDAWKLKARLGMSNRLAARRLERAREQD
jgi:hypothetical protein